VGKAKEEMGSLRHMLKCNFFLKSFKVISFVMNVNFV
jgi:hypothetical protein